MEEKSFRALDAWKESMALAETVYLLTRKFPDDQLYGLTQQAQKAAVSISSNIAEGHGRKTAGEFAYHLRVSRGSLAELETQLILAQRLGFIVEERACSVLNRIQTVGRLINGLLKYVNGSKVKSRTSA